MKKLITILLAVLLVFGCVACGNSEKENFTEISWPTSELVSRLPVPESTYGEIVSESADYFSVDIGNTSVEQFNAYVSACQENGYTVDYSKSSHSFSAYDAEGYYVWVNYSAEDMIMDIMTRIPEEEDDDTSSNEVTTTTTAKVTTTTTTAKGDDIDSDFKKAMDSYESFMNDYVEFMKKYQKNPADLSLLADYSKYMSDYTKVCNDFSDWGDKDLSTDELAYYLDVQTRVSKKLLEVAG